MPKFTAFVQNIAAPLVEVRNELAIAQAHVQLASLNPLLARALDLAHRYHCEAALRRVALVPGSGHGLHLVVGFADLVGFTALSQTLPTRELAAAIGEFESRATETVTDAGGRVIKLIGDEVMFVAEGAEGGCEIALRLVEVFRDDALLPPIRAGLASGETITQEGDYYGPVVNLAARVTKTAQPGTVLVPEELKDEVDDAAGFAFRRIGRRRLKGFDETIALYALQRAKRNGCVTSYRGRYRPASARHGQLPELGIDAEKRAADHDYLERFAPRIRTCMRCYDRA